MSPITQYTYAISLLNYKLSRKYIYENDKVLTTIKKTPRVINYQKVWNNQSVDSELKKHLLKFSEKVFNYINYSITHEKVGTNIAMSARNKKNFWGPLLNYTIDYNLEDQESESFAISIEEYEKLKIKSSKDKQKEELQEIEGYVYNNHDEILKILVENRVLENRGNKISKAFTNVRNNNITDEDIKIIKDEINKLTEEGVSFPS